MKVIYHIFLFFFVLTVPALAGTPSGYWYGNWNSTQYPGETGIISADLTKTGSSVTGIVSIETNECGTLSATTTGTITGATVTLQGTFYCGGQGIPTQFILPSSMGSTETGPYAIFLENGTTYDQGNWHLTRQTPATVQIAATADSGATISPSGNLTVDYKKTTSFSIAAKEGYTILDVLVNGSSVGPVSSYSVESPTTNTTIQVSSKLNEPVTPTTPVVLTPVLMLLLQ